MDHDLDLLRAADWVVELGPGGGREGGRVVAEGTPEDGSRSDRRGPARRFARIGTEPDRSPTPLGPRRAARRAIEVEHAREHNLADVSCRIPLGKLVVLTGPSGSGQVARWPSTWSSPRRQRRFTETLSPYARQFLPTLAAAGRGADPRPAAGGRARAAHRARRRDQHRRHRDRGRPLPPAPLRQARRRRTARTTTPPSPRARPSSSSREARAMRGNRRAARARRPRTQGHLPRRLHRRRPRRGDARPSATGDGSSTDAPPKLRARPRAHHRPRGLVRARRATSRPRRSEQALALGPGAR